MKRMIALFFLLCIGGYSSATEVSVHELSLSEVLILAEKESPDLKASHSREAQAKANLSVAKSYLYPSLDLSVVDSIGFAGSSSPTPSGFGGLLNSPFRVGSGVGVVGKFDIFDLERWYALGSSREGFHANVEKTKVDRMKIAQEALSDFLEAVRVRGDMQVWEGITMKIEAVEETVKGFVNTGQYSDVSRLLIQDQVDEARMNQIAFEEKYKYAIKQLSLLTGLDEKTINCPSVSMLNEQSLGFLQMGAQSPLISHAQAEVSVARSQALQASSMYFPKLYVAGSVGYMDDERLVQKQDYSAWVGVTVPIFDGFLISSEVRRAQAIVSEKENQLLATHLELDQANVHYDEAISVARVEIKLLERQHEAAIQAFDLAKQRYLSFLGPVIDLREALRNLARIESQINDKKADLLLAIGSKVLFNGGKVNE